MDGENIDTADGVDWDSLVAQATRKALPEYQYMDAATLAWIDSHRHEVPEAAGIVERRTHPSLRTVLDAAPVPSSWHAELRIVDSIHGTRHLLRTAVLAAVLADLNGLSAEDTETLIVAAAIHDCRRRHDKDDVGHGERGGTWLAQHAEEVFAHFGVEYRPERAQQLSIAVRLHELPYGAFDTVDTAEYATASRVTDLLKTADALDRYRLPKRKWWPDDQHLRVVPPPGLKRLAFELVVDSEAAYLRGVDSAVAVYTSALNRGLL
jgi:hypothetical protein